MKFGLDKFVPSQRQHLSVKIVDSCCKEEKGDNGPSEPGHLVVVFHLWIQSVVVFVHKYTVYFLFGNDFLIERQIFFNYNINRQDMVRFGLRQII